MMGLFEYFTQKKRGRRKERLRKLTLDVSRAKPVRVSDYLSEQRICFVPTGLKKEEIFTRLIGCLNVRDPALALDALLEREKAGGTVLDSKVAIPHARLQGLMDICAAIGICREPMDGVKIYVLFFSSPEDTKTHLLFLSGVAALFQAEGLMDALIELTTAKDVLKTLRETEKGA